LEFPTRDRAAVETGEAVAGAWPILRALLPVIIRNRGRALARASRCQALQKACRKENPTVIGRAIRAVECLGIPTAVAGPRGADPAVADRQKIVAVAIPGLERAVGTVIAEIHRTDGEGIPGLVEHRISVAALVTVGMPGLRLVVIKIGQRLADLNVALRGPRGAAVIWVGRDGRVRRVGADVLKQPVVFGGKRRGTCSLQRISNRQEQDW